MAGSTQQQQLMTPGQLAAMTPAQQQAYLNSLDASSAASEQASLNQYKAQANASYLALCVEKIATCFPAAGGVTQAYASGVALIYNLPTASGGFAKDLLISVSISLALAAGTGATYAYTDAAFWGLFNEFQILFNGTQARIRPYLLRVMEMGRARSNPPPGAVVAGQANATITTTLATNQNLTLTGGSNVQVNGVFRIPLNALHQLSPVGMLPIQGAGTKAQLVLMTSTGFIGPDPMQNIVFASGGTGNAVTLNAGSTIKAEAIYMDGTNFNSPNPLSLDLVGVPTAQYIIETPLVPIFAGIVQRQRIATLLQHYYAIAVVMDGQSAGHFLNGGAAGITNIVGLELDQDSVGQNKFWLFGTANNVSVFDFWERVRHVWTQDMDPGVIPFVWAESYNQENPDNRMGNQVLNMTAGGWTDVHHGYILTTVGVVYTARVELYLVSLNPAGLVLA